MQMYKWIWSCGQNPLNPALFFCQYDKYGVLHFYSYMAFHVLLLITKVLSLKIAQLSDVKSVVVRLSDLHTHVCFCELWGHSIGIIIFSFYTVQTLHLNPTPYKKLCAFLLSQKTHSVWFISLLKYGYMGKCPHKSPSPCNTCHTHVIIQICVLICHKHTHTYIHTWTVSTN